MRMWMVDPKLMCRQHLLGEHLECHMFASTIKQGKSIKGYLENGLLEPHNLIDRHNELVEEMEARGYNHKSPLEPFEGLSTVGEEYIDREANLKELKSRCSECAKRQYRKV